MAQVIRVLMTKVGLDGHDRGARVVAGALREAGMEVIYTGLRQTPETIVETALQEDVRVVGISILSGSHMELLPRVMRLFKERKADDILVIAGGVIPREDAGFLKEEGIAAVFTPGTPTGDIVAFIKNRFKEEPES